MDSAEQDKLCDVVPSIEVPTGPAIDLRDLRGRPHDYALTLIKEHCPSIMAAIEGNDSLLKETAETTLSWRVSNISGADINYVVRFVTDSAVAPIEALELAEARYLELKKIVKMARGDADLATMAEELMKSYSSNIIASINNEAEHPRVKKAAEQALSRSILGGKGADYPFVKKHIQDNIQDKEDELKKSLKAAELDFIELREMIHSMSDDFKNKEENGFSAVVQSIQIGISRYNILFVMVLIVGLGWSAMNLPQSALALVSASIGAAIAHLLAERNSVLGQKEKTDRAES